MTGLAKTDSKVRGSVVAFIPKVFPAEKDGSPPDIPPIFGTGYIVHEDGLIATNDHVYDAFKKFQNPPGDDQELWPIFALMFHRIDAGIVQIPLEVVGVVVLGKLKTGKVYYGPPKLDLALVQVRARELPALAIEGELEIAEGMPVATAGFPMGSDLLRAPGWLHQLTPTLQQGIISAVQPFAAPKPHGFSTDIMIQGGASGSPVFLPDTGVVVGTLFASLVEPTPIFGTDDDSKPKFIGMVSLPTSHSNAVPSHYLSQVLANFLKDPVFRVPDDAQTIDEILAKAELVNGFRNEPPYKPLYEDDDGQLQLMIRKLDGDN